MRISTLIASASALVLVCAAGLSAATARQDAMVQPTAMHKWLQSHVGTWDAKVSGMMGESKGSMVVKPGPGDLWIVSEFKSEMMGMPFHGMELMGFDPQTKEFHQIWVDSMSTSATTMTGKLDKATQTLTTRGMSPGMDGAMVETTNVSHYPDADHMTMKMNAPGPDGSDMTVMTIEYTRRK